MADEIWAVEVTSEKVETTNLYLHVLENILNECDSVDHLQITFIYLLKPKGSGSTSRKLSQSSLPGRFQTPEIQSQKRIIHSEILEPLVKSAQTWWSKNSESTNRPMKIHQMTATWHMEVDFQPEVGLTRAVQSIKASRLYMFGKKGVFNGKLDKRSTYCSGNLPHCSLIIFGNGARIVHLVATDIPAVPLEDFSSQHSTPTSSSRFPPVNSRSSSHSQESSLSSNASTPVRSRETIIHRSSPPSQIAEPAHVANDHWRPLSHTVAPEPIHEVLQAMVAKRQESFRQDNELLEKKMQEFVKMEQEKRNEALKVRMEAERIRKEAEAFKKEAEEVQRLVDEQKSALERERAEYEIQSKKLSDKSQLFSAAEIERMCNGFDPNLVIGEGGFGTVYKGTYSHTTVAVKKVKDAELASAISSFTKEGEVHSSLRHPNVVLLMGHCDEPACLVYEFMDEGSLEDRLSCKNGTKPLTWIQRFEIFEDICLGLVYLHKRTPPVVHLDIKPANILLDKKLTAKLGDIGFAQHLATSQALSFVQMSRVVGTFGYIDPNFGNTGQFSVQSDIFSLGQVLWDILVGLGPQGERGRGTDNAIEALEGYMEDGNLEGMISEVDKTANWPPAVVEKLCKLATKCCERRRVKRPQLQEGVLNVVQELKSFIASYLEEEEEKMAAVRAQESEVPVEFICPITSEIMSDPVSDCNGHTFEKTAIEEWLRRKVTSPLTGATLRSTQLTYNYSLKSVIEQWKKNHNFEDS